ncbi:unnamed protein product [Closterium sp. NIES-53]
MLSILDISLPSLDAIEVASAFLASVACTSSTTRAAPLSFALESGASSCFFRDCTDLAPLRTPVSVGLIDSTAGPVVAHNTTTLLCLAAPSGFLTGYYTPSFSRNLVGASQLHDLGVVTPFPLVKPVASCIVGFTGVPLATFHWEPGSCLYSLHTGSHHSGQVRSALVAAMSCDYRSHTHPSVLWHHHLGHPSFPCLSRMRAAPHTSSFPPTTTPLQTLHLDVCGPSRPPSSPHVLPRQVCRTSLSSRLPHNVQSLSCLGVCEVQLRRDTAASSRRPCPVSPPGFPSVPRFPPRSSLRLVVAEPGGVPAGGTEGTKGVVGGGSGFGGAGAEDTGTATPTLRTVRFVTRVQCLDQLERKEREPFERAGQQQQQQQLELSNYNDIVCIVLV